MKLLLTLDFPPEIGGIQRYLFDRVAHRYGPEDIVVTGGAGHDAPALACRVVRQANPLARFNRKFLVINFIIFLARRETAATEIECGNIYAAIAPWVLSFFRPVRYRVCTYGGELLALQRRSIKAWFLKRVLAKSTGLYALGQYVEKQLRRAGIVNEVTIEPPRIDLPKDAAVRKVRDPGEFSFASPLRILSVGRLVPHKGHALLLDACGRLPDTFAWRLTIVGDGPLVSRLQSLRPGNGRADRVILRTGITDEALAEEYRLADLFILPSLETRDGTEGFGIVLLEAMAAGVPVIASRTGGIPEVVDDGACGALVEPGNAAALADTIASLANDREQRQRYVESARMRLKERYAWR